MPLWPKLEFKNGSYRFFVESFLTVLCAHGIAVAHFFHRFSFSFCVHVCLDRFRSPTHDSKPSPRLAAPLRDVMLLSLVVPVIKAWEIRRNALLAVLSALGIVSLMLTPSMKTAVITWAEVKPTNCCTAAMEGEEGKRGAEEQGRLDKSWKKQEWSWLREYERNSGRVEREEGRAIKYELYVIFENVWRRR